MTYVGRLPAACGMCANSGSVLGGDCPRCVPAVLNYSEAMIVSRPPVVRSEVARLREENAAQPARSRHCRRQQRSRPRTRSAGR